MLTMFARLRRFVRGEGPRRVPLWMQAIGMELEMRYDLGREPLPQPIRDALTKIEDVDLEKKRSSDDRAR